jgi:hypothetical protein
MLPGLSFIRVRIRISNMSSSNSNSSNEEDPFSRVLDNYMKAVEYMERNPKMFKREDIAEFKQIFHSEMPDYPTLFCKIFSGDKEADRDADMIALIHGFDNYRTILNSEGFSLGTLWARLK